MSRGSLAIRTPTLLVAIAFLVVAAVAVAFWRPLRPGPSAPRDGAAGQRPGEATREVPRSAVTGVIIAVDAGHGGEDGGVTIAGVVEKDVNLQVSELLRVRLEAMGARVVLTREGDESVFVDARTSLNLRLYKASQGEAQMFVSIHSNSFPDPSQFGAQTFYHPKSAEGRRAALLLQEELVRLQPENYREALAGDFYVLRNSDVPAVLVEVGFLSNPDDRRKLVDPAYQARLAEAIARGVERFFAGDVPEHRPATGRPGPPPGFIQHIYPPEVR